MLLNVNTYANSVIESSLALMKFMEVHIGCMVSTVDVRELMYILRKWTANWGVMIPVNSKKLKMKSTDILS